MSTGNTPTEAITAYGASDRGSIREINEDAYWLNTQLNVYAVADGLGGLPNGDVASGLAMEQVVSAFERNPNTSFIELFDTINLLIHERALVQNPDGLGMATTLTVGRIFNNKLYIGHVGDTGVFLYRDYKLTQLTQDHTMENDILTQLKPGEEVILPPFYRNTLTRCIGPSAELEVATYEHDLQQGDRLIFFSDGLTKVVEPDVICKFIQNSPNPQVLVQTLIAYANEKGAPDNVTTIGVYLN